MVLGHGGRMAVTAIDDIKPTTSCEDLWTVAEPNIAERVILDLSVVINRRMGGGLVVRYQAQVIAYSMFEQLGLEECLAEIAKGPSCDC